MYQKSALIKISAILTLLAFGFESVTSGTVPASPAGRPELRGLSPNISQLNPAAFMHSDARRSELRKRLSVIGSPLSVDAKQEPTTGNRQLPTELSRAELRTISQKVNVPVLGLTMPGEIPKELTSIDIEGPQIFRRDFSSSDRRITLDSLQPEDFDYPSQRRMGDNPQFIDPATLTKPLAWGFKGINLFQVRNFHVEHFEGWSYFLPVEWAIPHHLFDSAMKQALVYADPGQRLADEAPLIIVPVDRILYRGSNGGIGDHLSAFDPKERIIFLHQKLPSIVQNLEKHSVGTGHLLLSVILTHHIRRFLSGEADPDTAPFDEVFDQELFMGLAGRRIEQVSSALAREGFVGATRIKVSQPRERMPHWPKDYRMALMLSKVLVGKKIHAGSRVLEIGTGSGVLTRALVESVKARGIPDVHFVANDISQDAVSDAARLLKEILHYENVEVRKAGEFHPGEMFDVIFWNPPWFSKGSKGRPNDQAWLDENREQLREFFQEMPARLIQGGSMMIVLPASLFGDLQKLAGESSLQINKEASYNAGRREIAFYRIARAELRQEASSNAFAKEQIKRIRELILAGSPDFREVTDKIIPHISQMSRSGLNLLKEGARFAESEGVVEHPAMALWVMALYLLDLAAVNESENIFDEALMDDLDQTIRVYNENLHRWKRSYSILSLTSLFTLVAAYEFLDSNSYLTLSRQLKKLPGDMKYRAIGLFLVLLGMHFKIIFDTDEPDFDVAKDYVTFALQRIRSNPNDLVSQQLKDSLVSLLIGMRGSFSGEQPIYSVPISSRFVGVASPQVAERMRNNILQIYQVLQEYGIGQIIEWIQTAKNNNPTKWLSINGLFVAYGFAFFVFNISHPIEDLFSDPLNPNYAADFEKLRFFSPNNFNNAASPPLSTAGDVFDETISAITNYPRLLPVTSGSHFGQEADNAGNSRSELRQQLLDRLAFEADLNKRAQIAEEMGLDTRPIRNRLLDVLYVAHDMAVSDIVNPDGRPLRVFYKAAGADVSNVLLSTDATEIDFNAYYFGLSISDLARMNGVDDELPELSLTVYRDMKFLGGYGGVHEINFEKGPLTSKEGVLHTLRLELAAMGIDPQQVKVYSDERGYPRIRFEWAYPGRAPRERSISFIDAGKGNIKYHPVYDIFYLRAGQILPHSLWESPEDNFITQFDPHLAPGGFYVTDNVAGMDNYYVSYADAFPFPYPKIKLPVRELFLPIILPLRAKLYPKRLWRPYGDLYGWDMNIRQKPVSAVAELGGRSELRIRSGRSLKIDAEIRRLENEINSAEKSYRSALEFYRFVGYGISGFALAVTAYDHYFRHLVLGFAQDKGLYQFLLLGWAAYGVLHLLSRVALFFDVKDKREELENLRQRFELLKSRRERFQEKLAELKRIGMFAKERAIVTNTSPVVAIINRYAARLLDSKSADDIDSALVKLQEFLELMKRHPNARTRAWAKVFPKAEYWLLLPVSYYLTIERKLINRTRKIAETSFEASIIFLGLLGIHLRSEHLEEDDADLKLYPILLARILPVLKKMLVRSKRQQPHDRRRLEMYARGLFNGLLFVPHLEREGAVMDPERRLEVYRAFLKRTFKEMDKLGVRNPEKLFREVIRQIAEQFPRTFSKERIPRFAQYYGEPLAEGEFIKLAFWNEVAKKSGKRPITARTLALGGAKRYASENHDLIYDRENQLSEQETLAHLKVIYQYLLELASTPSTSVRSELRLSPRDYYDIPHETPEALEGDLSSNVVWNQFLLHHLHITDLSRLKKLLTSGNNPSVIQQVGGKVSGEWEVARTVLLPLHHPIQLNGRTFRAIKVKGILISPNKPIPPLSFDDARQPKTYLDMEFGVPFIYQKNPEPEGTIEDFRAEWEYYGTLAAWQAGHLVNPPLGYGRITNLTFHYYSSREGGIIDQPVAYFLSLITDPADQKFYEVAGKRILESFKKYGGLSAEEADQQPEIQELKRWLDAVFERFAVTARRLNEKFIHGFLHTGNVNLEGDEFNIHDNDNLIPLTSLESSDRLGYFIFEFTSFLRSVHELDQGVERAAGDRAKKVYGEDREKVFDFLKRIGVNLQQSAVRGYFKNAPTDPHFAILFEMMSDPSKFNAEHFVKRVLKDGHRIDKMDPFVQLLQTEFRKELELPLGIDSRSELRSDRNHASLDQDYEIRKKELLNAAIKLGKRYMQEDHESTRENLGKQYLEAVSKLVKLLETGPIIESNEPPVFLMRGVLDVKPGDWIRDADGGLSQVVDVTAGNGMTIKSHGGHGTSAFIDIENIKGVSGSTSPYLLLLGLRDENQTVQNSSDADETALRKPVLTRENIIDAIDSILQERVASGEFGAYAIRVSDVLAKLHEKGVKVSSSYLYKFLNREGNTDLKERLKGTSPENTNAKPKAGLSEKSELRSKPNGFDTPLKTGGFELRLVRESLPVKREELSGYGVSSNDRKDKLHQLQLRYPTWKEYHSSSPYQSPFGGFGGINNQPTQNTATIPIEIINREVVDKSLNQPDPKPAATPTTTNVKEVDPIFSRLNGSNIENAILPMDKIQSENNVSTRQNDVNKNHNIIEIKQILGGLNALLAVEKSAFQRIDHAIEELILSAPIRSDEERSRERDEFSAYLEDGKAVVQNSQNSKQQTKIKQAAVFFPRAIEEIGAALRQIVETQDQVILFVDGRIDERAVNSLIYGVPGAKRVKFVYNRPGIKNALLELGINKAHFIGFKGTSDEHSMNAAAESLRGQPMDVVFNSVASRAEILSIFRIIESAAANWKSGLVFAKSA